MSLNKIMSKIKEWNNKKNRTDMKYTDESETAFYDKETNVHQVLNDISFANSGNGIQY